MPGVPTGKACDACRRQKKKCDEKSPACSRCIRLDLECIGSGLQRYKFQSHQFLENHQPRKPGLKNLGLMAMRQADAIPQEENIAATLLRLPPTWGYGLFMFEIPRRMNTNEALDTAVHALVCAHSDFSSRQTASVKSLSSYSHALKVLRQCLNEPAKACASETLCAVMLLLICQNLIGAQGSHWSGHCEGAANILKARSCMSARNDFEQQILLSLRGSVLFEGLFNDRIKLTSEEWMSLVGNELDVKLPEGQLMRCLSHLPGILRRGRTAVSDDEIEKLRNETKLLYQTSKTFLDPLHKNWAHFPPPNPNDELKKVLIYAYYQRAYGAGLMMIMTINVVLQALTPTSEAMEVEADAKHLIQETFGLAQLANVFRPLGSAYMVIAFIVAWLAATNESDKESAEILLHDYRQDFPMHDMQNLDEYMKWTLHQLQALRRDR